MLFVLASDFMIRGYDDPNLNGIATRNLVIYQLLTLATLIGAGISTMFVRRPYEVERRLLQPEMRIGGGLTYGILVVGIVVLVVQLAIRMVYVDWSLDLLIQQMLGPRDNRLWDMPDAIGNRSAVLQLVSGMVPLAAMSFAFLIFQESLFSRIVSAFLLLVSLAILISDGSRTMALIPIIAFGVFGLIKFRSTAARVALIASLSAVIAVLTSAIFLFRSVGFQNSQEAFALTYHQDDSIYRVWSACAFADFSDYRMNPWYFFYYTVSIPIPRALWEGKPLLTDDFYGGYKLYYVTISFLGEWVSMLGTYMGFIAAFIFANVLYRVFYWSQRLLTMPLGVAAYLLCTVYVYMIVRSMPNMTIFIFAPAASLLLVWFASRRGKVGQSVSAPQSGAAW